MASYQSYTYRMPSGFPGDLQRAEVATVVPELIDSAAPPLVYGVPVKLVGGKIQPINLAADTAASIYGFNLRPYPFQNTVNDALGTTTAAASGATDILKRGFLMVKVNGAAAAAKNGAVYVRVAGGTTAAPVGGIEAAADATAANTVLIPNAYFNGVVDAFGVVELAFNL